MTFLESAFDQIRQLHPPQPTRHARVHRNLYQRFPCGNTINSSLLVFLPFSPCTITCVLSHLDSHTDGEVAAVQLKKLWYFGSVHR